MRWGASAGLACSPNASQSAVQNQSSISDGEREELGIGGLEHAVGRFFQERRDLSAFMSWQSWGVSQDTRPSVIDTSMC